MGKGGSLVYYLLGGTTSVWSAWSWFFCGWFSDGWVHRFGIADEAELVPPGRGYVCFGRDHLRVVRDRI